MRHIEMLNLIDDILLKVKDMHTEGQKEYAMTQDNVFANFERIAANLDISREQALMVYLLKHMDGINAWIKGHKSQRENVTGRIKDAIVYLCLLWGMTEEEIVSEEEIDAFFDEQGFKPGGTFNEETGEVSFEFQAIGDETI